jgi:CRP-like cAMP-binding protein
LGKEYGMEKAKKQYGNAVFIVTGEEACPYYKLGDELRIEGGSLSISSFKPVCLSLAHEIAGVVSSAENMQSFSQFGRQLRRVSSEEAEFNCGGCEGLIDFKFKQEKSYTTLQMQLLKESDAARKRQHLEKFYGLMRSLPIFTPLEDDALRDLTLFFDFKNYLPKQAIVERGAAGMYLYFLIKGQVDVIDDDGGKLAKISSGEIFGELGFLSGEPHSHTILTATGTQLAQLSVKNFREILKEHPSLQIFLFKLLIDRVQAAALQAGDIVSGITGDLEDVSVVDLMQLINSSQKTGVVELVGEGGMAKVFFNEGEVVGASLGALDAQKAFSTILGITKGRFTYKRGLPKAYSGISPLGGFMGLIMEGVQKIDEQNENLSGSFNKNIR